MPIAGVKPYLLTFKNITFCLFSAQGANQRERSPFLFGKAKGRAEKRLSNSAIKTKYIFRPAFINPGRKSATSGLGLWAFKAFYMLFPFIGIDAVDLAKTMIHVGLNGCDVKVLENRDIRNMAKRLLALNQ